MKEYLKTIHPNHPVFAVPEERFKLWRDTNIKGSKYEGIHCDQIVEVLDDFFDRPQFYDHEIQLVIKIDFNVFF